MDNQNLRVAEAKQIVAEFRTLETMVLDRIQLARQINQTYQGNRDLYQTLGYPLVIAPMEYRNMYERGGIAGRVIEAFPKATWRGGIHLVEDEDPNTQTAFEQAWDLTETQHHITSVMYRADVLAGLGQYSVILIGSPATSFQESLVKGNNQLLYLRPYPEEFVIINEYVQNAQDPRYGMPLFYSLKGPTNIQSVTLDMKIHWTRVIHIAENTLENDIFGQPRLKRVWNDLLDLMKVSGGGAEAFWLRANQGMHIDIDKDMQMASKQPGVTISNQLSEADLANMRADLDKYRHNVDRVIRTRGTKIEMLGSDVADFNSPQDAKLTLIAGTLGIPKRILTGSEMGQLASGQDRDNWDTQVQDRRTTYAGPHMLRRLVDRFIEFGFLPTPKQYTVSWAEIENLTKVERADGALKWATINKMQHDAGLNLVFTSDEIRDEWADKDPLSTDDMDMSTIVAPETDTSQVNQIAAALGNGGIATLVVKP